MSSIRNSNNNRQSSSLDSFTERSSGSVSNPNHSVTKNGSGALAPSVVGSRPIGGKLFKGNPIPVINHQYPPAVRQPTKTSIPNPGSYFQYNVDAENEERNPTNRPDQQQQQRKKPGRQDLISDIRTRVKLKDMETEKLKKAISEQKADHAKEMSNSQQQLNKEISTLIKSREWCKKLHEHCKLNYESTINKLENSTKLSMEEVNKVLQRKNDKLFLSLESLSNHLNVALPDGDGGSTVGTGIHGNVVIGDQVPSSCLNQLLRLDELVNKFSWLAEETARQRHYTTQHVPPTAPPVTISDAGANTSTSAIRSSSQESNITEEVATSIGKQPVITTQFIGAVLSEDITNTVVMMNTAASPLFIYTCSQLASPRRNNPPLTPSSKTANKYPKKTSIPSLDPALDLEVHLKRQQIINGNKEKNGDDDTNVILRGGNASYYDMEDDEMGSSSNSIDTLYDDTDIADDDTSVDEQEEEEEDGTSIVHSSRLPKKRWRILDQKSSEPDNPDEDIEKLKCNEKWHFNSDGTVEDGQQPHGSNKHTNLEQQQQQQQQQQEENTNEKLDEVLPNTFRQCSCGKIISNNTLYHDDHYDPNNPDDKINCIFCPETFTSGKDIQQHIQDKHIGHYYVISESERKRILEAEGDK